MAFDNSWGLSPLSPLRPVEHHGGPERCKIFVPRSRPASGSRRPTASSSSRPRSISHAVGELADVVRRRKNGDRAYYNFNLHLNPTNLCIFRCALCAYSRDEDDPRAYTMSEADAVGAGQGGGRRRLHRATRRQRRASAEDVRLVPGHDPRSARGLPPRAPEGLDRRGDRPFRPQQQAIGRVDPGRVDRRGFGEPARRRGRNLRPAGPQRNLSAQGRRPHLAGDPSHGPSARAAHERLDALRPHREHRTPRRSSGAVAALAGRHRRLSSLRAAGLSSGEYGPLVSAPHLGAGRPAAWWPSAG